MTADLIRIEKTASETRGILLLDGSFLCCTLENPDRNNQRNVSCIPCGNYVVKRVKSPRYGETFEITNVPDRSHILFHAGNTHKDTEGCILLGQTFSELGDNKAVLNSRNTVKRFMEKLAGTKIFSLYIKEA